MMVLDFANVEPWSCSLWGEPNTWPFVLYYSSFLGNGIFTIDDADFTSDYPLLGFARQLKYIAIHLKQSGRRGRYAEPEWEDPNATVFFLDPDDPSTVIVGAVKRRDKAEKILYSAKVPLDELVISADQYFDRVLAYCSQLCPEIKTSREIQEWLTDLTIPTDETPYYWS